MYTRSLSESTPAATYAWPDPTPEDPPLASDTAPGARERQKSRTREKLLDAALEMLETDSFSSLSLRGITRRVGIVPTAFYRHFPSMDDLGMALVDEAFVTLRSMIREGRDGGVDPERVIDGSIDILFRYVRSKPGHFRFIAREMYGGAVPIREAIHENLRTIVEELASDLAAFPIVGDWDARHRLVLGDLFVKVMMTSVGEMLDSDDDVEDAIRARTEQQMRMIVVGIPGWHG